MSRKYHVGGVRVWPAELLMAALFLVNCATLTWDLVSPSPWVKLCAAVPLAANAYTLRVWPRIRRTRLETEEIIERTDRMVHEAKKKALGGIPDSQVDFMFRELTEDL